MSFYVLDENNNKVPAYDKEGVLALLSQAINDGTLETILADAAFITKLKCCVGGGTYKVAFITQATYNELKAENLITADTYYFITDDTTAQEINSRLNEFNDKLAALDAIQLSIVNINETIKNINNSFNESIENINNSFTAYSKKSEARQYIKYQNFNSTSLIFDNELDAYNQPRVNLKSLLLEGKTADDTIGISGRLHVYFEGSSDYHIVYFNVLWDDYGSINAGQVNLMFRSADKNKLYLMHFSIGINTSNKLYIQDKGDASRVTNVTDNKTEYVSKIELYFLNIYYK